MAKTELIIENFDSKESKFFDDTNKKVIGKMKDDYGGVIIDQFTGLKSKI